MAAKESPKVEISEFMLEEYKQMIAAYFDLGNERRDMFQFYLALLTIPPTLIAAIFGLEKQFNVGIVNLPDVVTLLLFAVAIAGLIVTALIVDLRFESLLYAKTVNKIRGYFAEKVDRNHSSGDYLKLPRTTEKPKDYEQPWDFKESKWKDELMVGSTFLEVVLMGLLNSTYFGLAITNILWKLWQTGWSIFLGLILGATFLSIHLIGYRYFATKRDELWPTRISQKTSNGNTQD